MAAKRPSLAEMIAKASEGPTGRSPIHTWLRKNYRELHDVFEATGPNWSGLLKVMHQQGVNDRAGNPPTLKNIQQHWYRLCRKMAALPTPKPPSPAPVPGAKPPGTIPIAVRPVAAPMVLPASPPSPSATSPEIDPLADLIAQMEKQ